MVHSALLKQTSTWPTDGPRPTETVSCSTFTRTAPSLVWTSAPSRWPDSRSTRPNLRSTSLRVRREPASGPAPAARAAAAPAAGRETRDGLVIEAVSGPYAVLNGRPVLNFVSSNYLGIAAGTP